MTTQVPPAPVQVWHSPQAGREQQTLSMQAPLRHWKEWAQAVPLACRFTQRPTAQ